MKTGETTNKFGTPVSEHVCDTCGTEFTVCPAVEGSGWGSCMAQECASYDPDRDADALFMSDEEIRTLPIVSMDKLRQRQKGTKLHDGTWAANLSEI